MNAYETAIKRREWIAYVCHKHGVTQEMLIGKRRTKPIVLARHEAMWGLRKLGLSYPRIGALLGGRDHSTVIHGVRKHAERINPAVLTPGANEA